ncbi:hypothetical protein B0J12DRAFT_790806 [Macrophomina phaseolina]|uniref:Azaphilone pigments biosynthesis cluster protein L N-terminal domain-containing protein n=1 Tax=Macrophomina phaseolina TaxID=35725 RepID=A0ABQ8FTQ3_9PEZI|nr:hypothetical protein B0J12DRAFT_790806 [Macrophomina phaseolina]
MESLGITSAAVGITMAALQSIQILATTIDNIKDAPDTVKSINDDLRAVQPVLQTLYQELQSSSSQIILSSPIKCAIENCDRACVAFRLQIERWTRHSTEEKTFWIDRWNIGLFGQERIKTFKAQLNDCKGTLNVALSTATTITTSRQDTRMKEMHDMMLLVQEQLVRADNDAAGIERSLQRLTVEGNSELSHGSEQSKESEQSRQELLEELKNQQAANAALKQICEEVRSKTKSERTGQTIKDVKATRDSLIAVGFMNTSAKESGVEKQYIKGVTADHGSKTLAGVAKDVNVEKFF